MTQTIVEADPDSILRDIYSRYSKSLLENSKESIILLPTYENAGSVRHTLTQNGFDVSKFEENGSLLILDSVKGYFGLNSDFLSTIEMLAKRADML